MKNNEKTVVVGCSGCGALAAMTIKRIDASRDVTIIREPNENGLLTRCATPYICCGDIMVDPSYKDDSMFTGRGIKLVSVSATGIDRKNKTVITSDGNKFKYDKLVLAMGAVPSVPPVKGVDLPGVFTLRTSDDAVAILNWINSERIKDVVLVGGGAIGVEEAYLLQQRGMGVTVVEMAGSLMTGVLDRDMSREIESYMKKNGINLKFNCKLSGIRGDKNVESVELDSGEVVDTRMVIISTGARCNASIAGDAGLELGKHGVRVNEYLRTTDPDIYAGGDIIEYDNHVTGKPGPGRLRPNAVIAGRVIAKNILGFKVKYPSFINSFSTKYFDKSIAGAGITEEEASRQGIETITAKQQSTSRHSMMRGRKPYIVKLVFNKKNHCLIGGQIISDSECPVRYIDVITVAIRCNLKIMDLTTLRLAGQPELSPDPGREPIALAAESAFDAVYA